MVPNSGTVHMYVYIYTHYYYYYVHKNSFGYIASACRLVIFCCLVKIFLYLFPLFHTFSIMQTLQVKYSKNILWCCYLWCFSLYLTIVCLNCMFQVHMMPIKPLSSLAPQNGNLEETFLTVLCYMLTWFLQIAW